MRRQLYDAIRKRWSDYLLEIGAAVLVNVWSTVEFGLERFKKRPSAAKQGQKG